MTLFPLYMPSSSFQGPTRSHSSPQQNHNQQQQQQMIQQLLHTISNNNGTAGEQPTPRAAPNGGGGPMLNKCGSLKAPHSRVGDVSQSMNFADEMVHELTNGFTDNGFFSSSSLEDTLGFGSWKA